MEEDHLKEVTEALQKINPMLRKQEPYSYHLQDMVEVVLNSCIRAIGYTYLYVVTEGTTFKMMSESQPFKVFLKLYGEMCSHVNQRLMGDIEVDESLISFLQE